MINRKTMVDQEGEYLLVIKSTGDIPYSDSTKLLNISGARLWPLNIGREIIFSYNWLIFGCLLDIILTLLSVIEFKVDWNKPYLTPEPFHVF